MVKYMKYVHVRDVLEGKYDGKKVALRGWVHRIRKQKTMVFALLRDHSGVVQTVIKQGSVSNQTYADADRMLVESLITLEGVAKADPRAEGGYEVQVDKLQVLQFAEEFPITEDQSVEFLNDYRHLWLRSRKITNILKVRDEVFYSSREYLRKNGFYETTSPMFVATMGEEGAEMFEVDYFGRKAYLTQTSQMHLEPQIVALERVFTLAPSFRAEKSRTRKHLTEYWHLEVEEAWCDHEANLKRQEELISYICQSVAKNRREELKELGVDYAKLEQVKPPFDRITYGEAVEICSKAGLDIKWGEDIRTEAEEILTRDSDKFLFVQFYPKEIKSFYMKHNEADPRTYRNDDLLAPRGFGEIIGGSQREDEESRIIENLQRIGDDPAKYKWYIELRKYGSVEHSGFGVGIDRLITWMLNLEHIRECVPFPRDVRRLYP
ncbi:MAG: asparagine--tRNA ligase [Candidatus Thorarchaeota archaeon]|nr:MAG: asparagine--tRNA ligase [Candidatus Thorarchaeota archaeon]